MGWFTISQHGSFFSAFLLKKVRLVSSQSHVAGSVRLVVFSVIYASGWSPSGPQGSVGLLRLMAQGVRFVSVQFEHRQELKNPVTEAFISV